LGLPVLERRTPAWWDASLTCLFWGAVLYACSLTLADPDLWGHLRFGQDFWATGQVIRTDPYSYLTAGRLWINHEWLSEAVFAAVFSRFGPLGLGILKTAVCGLTVWIGRCFLLRRGLSPLRANLLLALSLLPFIHHFGALRPGVFSFLFFLLTLLTIHAAEAGERRALWLAPLFFALWANLHGGFLAGLGLLFLWALLRPRRLGVFLGCTLATLANPYGIRLWLFLWRTATGPRWDILEWNPISIRTVPGAGYVALLACAILGFALSRRRLSRTQLALWAVTALLPLLAARHSLFFVMGLWVFAGEHIADAWDRFHHGDAGPGARARAALSGLHFAAAAALVVVAWRQCSCIRMEPEVSHYPIRAVALLKASGAHGDMVVHFDWGEYALHHLGPRVRVSMDGRRETIYSPEVYREHLDFIMGVGRWDAVLDRGRPELALVSRRFPEFNLMSGKNGWGLAYEDEESALFARQDSPWLAALRELARQRGPGREPACADL